MFCQPQNTEECAKILQLANRTNVRVWILGLGSNVLVADNGIKGLVISTKKMNGIRYSDGNIITGSGAALAQVSLFFAWKSCTARIKNSPPVSREVSEEQ